MNCSQKECFCNISPSTSALASMGFIDLVSFQIKQLFLAVVMALSLSSVELDFLAKYSKYTHVNHKDCFILETDTTKTLIEFEFAMRFS